MLTVITCLLLNAPTLLTLTVIVIPIQSMLQLPAVRTIASLPWLHDYTHAHTQMYLSQRPFRAALCKFTIHVQRSLIADSTRWWDSNPFDGMVRIVAGYYSNGGRVEVYCNGKWGTVCKEGFYTLDANTICKQLGYDSSYKHNSLYM